MPRLRHGALSDLNGRISALAEEASDGFVLFADRFPFVYLTEEYEIEYAAAFQGCTTDSEADFDTILRLARIVDGRGLRYLVVTESSDKALAESVRRATANKDQAIVVMDSMQSVTEENAKNGVTYLSLMEKNLTILEEVLMNKPNG